MNDDWKDFIRLMVMVAFAIWIFALVSGCATSLGAAPAREWTEEDDQRCYRRGGLPTYNHNSERTMCSSDMVW